MMSNTLVAYFSATGVTARMARKLAALAEADLFEIIPEEPYTKEDLDWTNKNSRSSVEMANKTSRPAIKKLVENMKQYDVICIAFPIWWYVAPHIINTFLESYDLSGKAVILFATSGGSGFGKTVEELRSSCNADVLKEGKVINSADMEQEIKAMLQ